MTTFLNQSRLGSNSNTGPSTSGPGPLLTRQHASSSNLPSAASNAAASTATMFRNLIFEASVPLAISIRAEDVPQGSDKVVETLYLQVPRISYLPLILQDVRRDLIELVLDESAAAGILDESIWFEYDGVPLRWHWPIGLLYDYHTAQQIHGSNRPSSPSTNQSLLSPSRTTQSPSTTTTTTTNRLNPNPNPNSYFPSPSSSPTTPHPNTTPNRQPYLPFKLTLHLQSPPLDKLLMSPSVESCRANYMNMVKEADAVRWGSSKRITSLRSNEQDALWEGIVNGDFDKFWQAASKLIPSPSPNTSTAQTPQQPSSQSIPGSPAIGPGGGGVGSTLGVGGGGSPSSNALRNVPMRVYLPSDLPVLQELVPPIGSDGRPTTLHTALSLVIPSLFPPIPTGFENLSSSFMSPNAPGSGRQPMAGAVIQGVSVPLDAEVGWISSCLCGGDGWVGVVVVLNDNV